MSDDRSGDDDGELLSEHRPVALSLLALTAVAAGMIAGGGWFVLVGL